MRAMILFVVACFSLVNAKPCFSAQRVLQAWDFAKAADPLGWKPAEGLKEYKISDGALIGTAGPGRPKLESPLFDIQAAPFQFIEIELRTDSDGDALVYYSNTTDPPYGGFRPELLASFGVKGDGKYHKYAIMPFWQKLGKIIHVRVDPPGDNFAIRSIRISELEPASGPKNTQWDFRSGNNDWLPTNSEQKVESTGAGLQINGNRDTVVLSPMLDLEAESYPLLTVRIGSKHEGTAMLRWVADDANGLQSVPVRVIGDGKVHSYLLELSEISSWSGRIRALAITPVETSESASIVVESLALANAPVGPAELQITRFEPDTPILRAGETAKIVAEVRNVGGEKADLVEVAILQSSKSRSLLTWSSKKSADTSFNGSLAPGDTTKSETGFIADTPGVYEVICRTVGSGVGPIQQTVKMRVYPAADKWKYKGVKYVPQPHPADTGDQLVGCYNFPGWRDYGAWSVLDNFPERKPVLGYYHDGNPEVADWQINWALSHGISFFIYDWYWSAGGRHLEEGLNDGFLKSRYGDKMKFCLLWANHNPAGTHSEKDMEEVTKYWIENYFKRPNYLKVNGKNVIVIFAPANITTDLGVETAKKCFNKMRKMCEDAGVGGLYLVACCGPSKNHIDTLTQEGYDALSGYNYPAAGDKGQVVAPYSWMVDGYKEIWQQISQLSSIPYIPLCEAGWDSRPWHGATARVRTGKTPELWEKMLKNAKAFNDDPKHKMPEGQKLVFVEAWNEFGEGDYVEPNAGFGFSYLEAIRKVFAPKSKQPEIVLPKDLGMGPYDLPKPQPVSAWDFGKKEDQRWYAGNMTGLSYEGGVMSAQAQGNDPAFYSPAAEIDASKYKAIEIKMRTSATDTAQIFFAKPRGSMSENRSVTFPVRGDSEWHVYTVDMSSCSDWRGKIGAIRLDPNSTADSKVEIEYIKLK